MSVLRDFAPAEIAALERHLERVTWPAGHVIFRQGDPGTALFLVTRGRASVQISQAGTTIRLVTFVPGTVFGELAILDGGPRAATIVADEEVVAYSLGSHAFAELRENGTGGGDQAAGRARPRVEFPPALGEPDDPAA